MRKCLVFLLTFLLIITCKNNGTDPTRNVDPLSMEMVEVPAGEFEMGDNFAEGQANELPVHAVYLDSYFIGKYEVTNAQYERFMEDGGYTTPDYWGTGGFGDFGSRPLGWNSREWQGGGISGDENIPVVGVCWYEAMAFCAWLSAKTGETYRLPTEAEWEKAARGDSTANAILGHQRRYPWGDEINGRYTNYINSGDPYENMGQHLGKTPVGYYDGSIRGTFQTHDNSSPYGAYDMAGNVWELCMDWYGEDYYSNSPVNNPTGPESGIDLVFRGGCMHSTPENGRLRTAFRSGGPPPTNGAVNMGFRCVMEVE